MGPAEAIYTFDRVTLVGRRFFFRIVDTGNHEVLAPSQAYKTQRQRDLTANRLASRMGCPVIKGKPRK